MRPTLCRLGSVRFMQEVYVVVNFLSQVIFIFPLFLVMGMYANEFETKEK